MATISFNTTNVLSLDSIGKLYKIDVPNSEGPSAGEALVYSTSSVTNGRPKPENAIILTNDDADSSYFSIIDRSEKSKLSLVAAGGSLNLYVYSAPTTANGNVGNIDKYTFNAQGVLQTQDSLTNPLDIAYEEQQSARDLDGNAVVGGALTINGTLDKAGSLYQVSVAGQKMFIVGTTATAKSKTIDVDSTVLKVGSAEMQAEQKAWEPEEAYTSYSAVRSDDGGWDVFAYQAPSDSVTQFSFDTNNFLKSDFADGKVLKASEVASLEKQLGRNLNGDTWFGANISPTAIDAAGGLYKASIQGEDFFVVGANLKSSTKALGAVDLSSSLTNESGGQAWKEPDGYIIKSVVKSLIDDSLQVYLTPPNYNAESYKVLRFDFQLNETGNYQLDSENTDGVEVNPFDLAKAEKLSGRDLDKTYKFLSSPSQTQDEYGVSIVSNLDNVGGLYHATSLGQSYLIAGKNLVSNIKKITDLSSALTMEGTAWVPDGFTASELQGKISIVVNPNNARQADVYVKESDGFAKYSFTRSDANTPWTTTGNKVALTSEEIAAVEKTSKRDLNNDGFFGARITELKNAPGGLYSVNYGNLGTASAAATSDFEKIFIRSDVKLSLGSTVAKNAVDFSNALRSSEGFWAPPEGYQVTGAFKDTAASKYSVIISNGPSDFQKFTFDISGNQTQLIETGDDSSNAISTQELAALEATYKRDMNGDRITGVRIMETPDKLGGLFKVRAADGDYFVSKLGNATVNNLENAFFDESMNAWAPTKAEGTSISKLTLLQRSNADTQADEFLIYQKEEGSGNVYSKYTFDENHQLKNKTQLSLVDLANEETNATRDINGDGIIGAKVISPVDKNGGLYKVSIENKYLLVAVNPSSTPGRQVNLENALLSEDGNPLEINQAGVFQTGELAGWKVNASVRVVGNEGKVTTKVFALKSNIEGVMEVKRLTFEESTDSVDFANYKMLATIDTLNAQDLIAEETNQTYGKDLNADKAVGLKINQTVDKKLGLYSATVLGQNYYFFDTVNKKTGTTLGTSIDLSHAFYDADAKPWAMPKNDADEEPTKLAGLVKNVVGGEVVGYDIFTFKQKTVSGEFNVQKHSWNWDTETGLVYKGSAAADAAELVQVEKDNQRDLSGDGIVGFKLVGRSDVNDRYEGVTKATVFGNDTFFVVGKNLKPGTPSNPWKLSDALLSEDGTSAWSIPNIPVLEGSEINFDKMITAVRDIANSNDRFVYVKHSDADQSKEFFIQKYKFDKSTGKYSGESEKLDAVSFSAEEINFKRDLNNDGKLGVFSFSDVKLSTATISDGYTNIFSGQGKSSGLIKTTVNNIDFLVVKKLPNSNSLLNLDLALVNADGSAWKPSESFLLKGVYKNSTTNETEIYGYEPIADEGEEPDYSLKKYQFTVEDFTPNANALESALDGSTPKVLKLKSDPAAGYLSVSDLAVSERENNIGKDLNNDSVVGLKISTNPLATIPTGTGIGSVAISNSTSDETQSITIYVVGKSLSTMGATASRTANQNALREVDNKGNLSYWKPDAGFSIQSILESSNTVKVYAKNEPEDQDVLPVLKEYTFAKDESAETAGWNLESAASLSTTQIVDLEVSNYRDLNGDKTMGLTYSSPQSIQGIFTGTLNNETFYFAGQATRSVANGTAPFGIDTSKLLTNVDGNVWSTTDTYSSFSSVTEADGAPETAAFALRASGEALVFFNAQYQHVPQP